MAPAVFSEYNVSDIGARQPASPPSLCVKGELRGAKKSMLFDCRSTFTESFLAGLLGSPAWLSKPRGKTYDGKILKFNENFHSRFYGETLVHNAAARSYRGGRGFVIYTLLHRQAARQEVSALRPR
ncbi:unnamed protein product [Calypogeia fissa]